MFRVSACFALIAVAAFSVPALAQNRATTAEVTGLLEDSTGGVLPGVTVTVVNLDDGLVRSSVTDGAGRGGGRSHRDRGDLCRRDDHGHVRRDARQPGNLEPADQRAAVP